MRLDIYLAAYWPEHSRSMWQKLTKSGHVKVNGEVVSSPKYELGEDDAVTVEKPEQPDFINQTLPILYEDNNVTVINKPAGVLTHAKGVSLQEFSVAEFMRGRTTDGSDGNRPGIVHRLDRDTSGVIIAARNPVARVLLQKQFSKKNVKKTYLAIVEGSPRDREAIIKLPIERNPSTPSRFRVGASGKPAETSYRVLAESGGRSLLALFPLTGRTHQLRVHLSYIGHPIVHDRFYHPESGTGRLGLHAYQLEITLPDSKRTVFHAPVPSDFKQLLKGYKNGMLDAIDT